MVERTCITLPGIVGSPFLSPGVRVGDLLFVSGHVARDSSGNLVGEGDCEAQCRQVMANLRIIAEAAGATMQDVVKLGCFITDPAYYAAYRNVLSETFLSDPPASTTVVIAALSRLEFLVEMDAVVRVPN